MTKRFYKSFLSALLCLTPLGLYAQQDVELSDSIAREVVTTEVVAQSMIADEVVAIVGNISILYSDVQRTANTIARSRQAQGTLSPLTEMEEAFAALLERNFLATCAQIDSLDQELQSIDEMVERQVNSMAAEAGGVRELEKSTGKPIYQIKSDLTLEVQQQQLAQMMEQRIRQDVTIDYTEVAEFVDTLEMTAAEMIPVQYSYSQIVRMPAQTDERKYAIRERLLSYRQRILAGETNLGVLAQLYSMDTGSAMRRGEMGPQSIYTLVNPFVEAIEKMKPGEVSEIVETEYGYHLIELISKTDDATPIVHFRHILLKPEFTIEERNEVIDQLDSIAIAVEAGFLDFSVAAMKYSDDISTKQNGGRAFNTRGYDETGDIRAASSRFVAEELWPADSRQISSMKIGEISSPFETMDDKGNVVQKIVRLDDILPAHKANVIDDYDLLATIAERQKQALAVDKWIDKNIGRVYIEIKEDYWSMNLGRDGWVEAARKTKEGGNLNITYPTLEDIESAIEEYQFNQAARKLKEQAAARADAAAKKEKKSKKK